MGSDLADAVEVKGIHPIMNSLIKRGLADKGSVDRTFTNNKGLTTLKTYVTYFLTEAGRNYSN